MNENELELYIVNDGFLYRTSRSPIEETLTKLRAAGGYSRADALRRYQRLADNGAQRYAREFPDAPKFTLREREAAARGMLDSFETEWAIRSDSPTKSHAQLDREIAAAIGSRTKTKRH